MNISDEAVDLAARAIFQETHEEPWEGEPYYYRRRFTRNARAALEAAAPHMLAGLRDLVEDMERQPRSEIASVPGVAVLIRAAVGDLLATKPVF